MKRIKNKVTAIIAIIAITATMTFVSGCSDSTTTPMDNADLSTYGTNATTDFILDSLKIDTVKIYIKDIKLNVASSNDSSNFKTGPFVFFLNLSSNVNLMTTAQVPEGSYDKIKFEIHKIENGETPLDPEFVDANGRYSTIVKGYYNNTYFVYKSSVSAHQKLNFPTSISYSASTKTNITLRAEPYKWFFKNGNLLNPTLPANVNDIDNNIKNNVNDNIKAYKDNDRNGIPD